MTPQDYLRKSPLPNRDRWDHQVTAFLTAADKPGFFYSMEQRTGKTQPTIDTAGYSFELQKINTLLIPAMPSGAPRNWLDELNEFLPGRIKSKIVQFDVDRSGFTKNLKSTRPAKVPKNVSYAAFMNELVDFDGLLCISVNGEGVITDGFGAFMDKVFAKRKVMIAADETTLLMKTPGATRTKALYHLSKHASIKRCLDGTPTGEGPFDLFAQYRFLDPSIFGTEFSTFKCRYAQMESVQYGANAKSFMQIKKVDGVPVYQNLDELQRRISPYTYRVRFRDVFPNVPQPIYQKHYLQLTGEQRGTYDRLQAEYEAELKGLGTVTVANVLTRYLRLQQITSGFWPNSKAAVVCEACDAEGCSICGDLGIIETNIPLQRLVPFNDNPRLLALADEFKLAPAPCIIWARFNQDIDDVMELCRQLGRQPCQYDGRIDDETKYRNKQRFQGGEFDTFVAKTRSAGRAVNVSTAENMFYYSSEFGLNQRLQSEVRAETGLRTIATSIVDFIAENTKDEQIVASHRARRKLSDLILNEESGKWL